MARGAFPGGANDRQGALKAQGPVNGRATPVLDTADGRETIEDLKLRIEIQSCADEARRRGYGVVERLLRTAVATLDGIINRKDFSREDSKPELQRVAKI